jgi:predicted AAA+ superfamily ATPase
LEDTLIGIRLPVYHRSIRKRQRSNPKFYLFDLGVKKALERTLQQEIYPKTYAFGKAFEHFVIVEIHRLNDYFRKDWTFSYLQTKDGAEIDLIIDRPGMPTALVEIKSSEMISEKDVAQLNRFKTDIINSEAYCLSLDSNRKVIGQVNCLPWETGLKEIGFI